MLDKNFSRQLRQTRNDLAKVKEEVQSKNETKLYAIKARLLLELIQHCENERLHSAAVETSCLINSIFFSQGSDTEDLVSALNIIIQIIDEEIPKEEEIDFLEEQIKKIEVNAQIREQSESLTTKFHNSARKIARIIVEEQ